MAGGAGALPNRFMLGDRFFLSLDRVLMARPAKLDRTGLQKRLLRRRMRTVTIEASVFSQDRHVEAVFGEHLVDHGVMTASAQLKSLFLQGDRIC